MQEFEPVRKLGAEVVAQTFPLQVVLASSVSTPQIGCTSYGADHANVHTARREIEMYSHTERGQLSSRCAKLSLFSAARMCVLLVAQMDGVVDPISKTPSHTYDASYREGYVCILHAAGKWLA